MQTRFKHLQRKLRQRMTAPELILWQKIRNKQLGVKFRRQYAIDDRIIDFYSPEINLAIEIDGESHFINELANQKEIEKDKKLAEKENLKMLRFKNTDVMENLEGTVMKISEEIEKKSK